VGGGTARGGHGRCRGPIPGRRHDKLRCHDRAACQALENLRIALEESGAAIRDVLKTTVYVASANRQDLVAAWDEVAGFFGDHDAPSTLLGVAVLGYPGQLVEIEAVAVSSSR
jgi:enamine deaminase RidA (YjgF/YER057c/UK114 family)